MVRWQPASGCWQVNPTCDLADHVDVPLSAFRRVRPLEGPTRPPVLAVDYSCSICLREHRALACQDTLDLDPVTATLGTFWDSSRGQVDWAAADLSSAWAKSLAWGRWPLAWACPSDRRTVRLSWPSRLTDITPDHPQMPSKLLVGFRCSCCDRAGQVHIAASRLTFLPR